MSNISIVDLEEMINSEVLTEVVFGTNSTNEAQTFQQQLYEVLDFIKTSSRITIQDKKGSYETTRK